MPMLLAVRPQRSDPTTSFIESSKTTVMCRGIGFNSSFGYTLVQFDLGGIGFNSPVMVGSFTKYPFPLFVQMCPDQDPGARPSGVKCAEIVL